MRANLNIDIDKLHPHPDNPRAFLGDLTELTDSIRAVGVLQPLTVVQGYGLSKPDDFTVVIGHRRLAAAKAAPLFKVPCIVVEMTKSEQIAAMMIENEMREPLTPWQQSKGFQMMLDLGDSVEQVAEKTGFSESTVRRRIKLQQLDHDKMDKIDFNNRDKSKQIDLIDFERLFEIKDPDTRNECLKSIGNKDFDFKVQSKIVEEKRHEARQKLVDRMNTLGWQQLTNITSDYSYLYSINNDIDIDYVCEYYKDQDIYYRIDSYTIFVYRYDPDVDEEDDETEEDNTETKEAFNERKAKLQELVDILKIRSNKFVSEKFPDILKADRLPFMKLMLLSTIISEFINYGRVSDLLCIEFERNDYGGVIYSKAKDSILERFNEKPYHVMLVCAYAKIIGSYSFFNKHSLCYSTSYTVPEMYKCLEGMGFDISEEEWQLINGTHELYIKI
ncbi:MAG: ParB/RepB/Spo0J family partition protein [Candidatus Ornithomonoglobus sp.]